MPVVTPDDVLEGVKVLWDGSAALAAAVPGGFWHRRPKQGAVLPYAVASVEEGEVEEFSGLDYLQKFTVRIGVYSDSTPSDTGTIRGLIEDRFRRATAIAIPNASQYVHAKPVPGGLDLDPKTREAGNVLMATVAYEILIQANRG